MISAIFLQILFAIFAFVCFLFFWRDLRVEQLIRNSNRSKTVVPIHISHFPLMSPFSLSVYRYNILVNALSFLLFCVFYLVSLTLVLSLWQDRQTQILSLNSNYYKQKIIEQKTISKEIKIAEISL